MGDWESEARYFEKLVDTRNLEIADLRDELRQSQERERRLANILQRRCAVLRTALLDHLDKLEDECERALNSGSDGGSR